MLHKDKVKAFQERGDDFKCHAQVAEETPDSLEGFVFDHSFVLVDCVEQRLDGVLTLLPKFIRVWGEGTSKICQRYVS
jgi:hypothetical protein